MSVKFCPSPKDLISVTALPVRSLGELMSSGEILFHVGCQRLQRLIIEDGSDFRTSVPRAMESSGLRFLGLAFSDGLVPEEARTFVDFDGEFVPLSIINPEVARRKFQPGTLGTDVKFQNSNELSDRTNLITLGRLILLRVWGYNSRLPDLPLVIPSESSDMIKQPHVVESVRGFAADRLKALILENQKADPNGIADLSKNALAQFKAINSEQDLGQLLRTLRDVYPEDSKVQCILDERLRLEQAVRYLDGEQQSKKSLYVNYIRIYQLQYLIAQALDITSAEYPTLVGHIEPIGGFSPKLPKSVDFFGNYQKIAELVIGWNVSSLVRRVLPAGALGKSLMAMYEEISRGDDSSSESFERLSFICAAVIELSDSKDTEKREASMFLISDVLGPMEHDTVSRWISPEVFNQFRDVAFHLAMPAFAGNLEEALKDPYYALLLKELRSFVGEVPFPSQYDLGAWLGFSSLPSVNLLEQAKSELFPPYYRSLSVENLVIQELLREQSPRLDVTEYPSYQQIECEGVLAKIMLQRAGEESYFKQIENDRSLALNVIREARKGFFGGEKEIRTIFGDPDRNGALDQKQKEILDVLESIILEVEKEPAKAPEPVVESLREVEESVTRDHPAVAVLVEAGMNLELARKIASNKIYQSIVRLDRSLLKNAISLVLARFNEEQTCKLAEVCPGIFQVVANPVFGERALRLINRNLQSILNGELKLSLYGGASKADWGKRNGKRLENQVGIDGLLKNANDRTVLRVLMLDDFSGLENLAQTLRNFEFNESEIMSLVESRPTLALPANPGRSKFGDFFESEYLPTLIKLDVKDIKGFVLKHPETLRLGVGKALEDLSDFLRSRKLEPYCMSMVRKDPGILVELIDVDGLKKLEDEVRLAEGLFKQFSVTPTPNAEPKSLANQILCLYPSLRKFTTPRAVEIFQTIDSRREEKEGLTLDMVAACSSCNQTILIAALGRNEAMGLSLRDFIHFSRNLQQSFLEHNRALGNSVRSIIKEMRSLGMTMDEIHENILETPIVLGKHKSTDL